MDKNMGIHILLDLLDCPIDKLKNVESLRNICMDTVNHANLSVLKEHFHQFEPEGATGILLLEESHLNVHTWPEHNSVAADIFCCFLSEDNIEQAKEKAEKASKFLIEKFEAKDFVKNVYIR